MRFTSNAAVSSNITFQNLLDTILVATSATAGYDVFDAVRVNAVEVWGIEGLGTISTVGVVFDGATLGAAGDDKNHSDTSVGIQPAHVRASPAPLSGAAQFQPSTNTIAFLLVCPSNSVIDVSMTLRQPLAGAAVIAQNALVAATAGAMYYRGLDGKATATTVLPPAATVVVI